MNYWVVAVTPKVQLLLNANSEIHRFVMEQLFREIKYKPKHRVKEPEN